MSPLYIYEGKLLKRNNQLAINENCCCGCDCSERIYNYDYDNTGSKNWDQCPQSDQTCQNNASCCGETVNGFLNGPIVCCSCAETKMPKAEIITAFLDNFGTIAGVNSGPPGACGGLAGIVNQIVVSEMENLGGGKCRMRLSFSASNDGSCGPVGIASATIRFFFQDNPLP